MSVQEQPIENSVDTQNQNFINRVTIKIPPFYKRDPRVWFKQIESQFATSGITQSKTKFNYVFGALEPEILEQIINELEEPGDEDEYDLLKKLLTKNFSDSQTQRIRKLLNEIELGDLKPSQLLNKMKSLAPNDFPDAVLRTLWLQRLPKEMQTVLSISDDTLQTISNMADKIWEIKPHSSLYSINDSHQSTSFSPDAEKVINELRSEIQELKLMQRNSRSHFKQSKSPNRTFTRSRSKSQNRKGSTHFCFYHNTFGSKAKKCEDPCAFPKSKSNSEN